MTSETLEALKGSIKKWELIVSGEGADHGPDNCSLCKLFNARDEDDCKGCPIFAITSRVACYGTPYEQWGNHNYYKHSGGAGEALCPTCLNLAQAELDFLKSLLPKEEI